MEQHLTSISKGNSTQKNPEQHSKILKKRHLNLNQLIKDHFLGHTQKH